MPRSAPPSRKGRASTPLRAANLAPPINWVAVGAGMADSNGLIQFTGVRLNTNNNSGIFYRLAFP